MLAGGGVEGLDEAVVPGVVEGPEDTEAAANNIGGVGLDAGGGRGARGWGWGDD